MKKVFSIFVLLLLTSLICSCNLPHQNHIDNDGDGICDKCEKQLTIEEEKEPIDYISTKANFTFIPEGRNNLHYDELLEAYREFAKSKNADEHYLRDFKLYNYVTESISKKYNLDIIEIEFENQSDYYVVQNGNFYNVGYSAKINFNAFNHVAITDINEDGYIEILTSICAFADRKTSYYCDCQIVVVDTKTKQKAQILTGRNVTYFKENEDGIICIYDTGDIKPIEGDAVNGYLDKKYYDLATNLYDTPQINTTNFKFLQNELEASSDIYDVKVTIDEYSIKFPYIFEKCYTPFSFKIETIMTYHGETFTYTSPYTYLDGAVVSFVNSDNAIIPEATGKLTAIAVYTIYEGLEIENGFRYSDFDSIEPGVYDMVITYENESRRIKESIVIEDFLTFTR